MPRYSVSCKRDFLQAVDYLTAQVLKNFKQAFSYQSTRDIGVVLDVMTNLSSHLMNHLIGIDDRAFSSKFDQPTAETQMAFHISTHVVRFRDKVGISVRITEPSATLRLDESEFRICCETIERSFRRAVVTRKPRINDESSDQIAGFVVQPIDRDYHGFEIHRTSGRASAVTNDSSNSEDLRFVSGRMSMKPGKDDTPAATILLLFSHDAGV